MLWVFEILIHLVSSIICSRPTVFSMEETMMFYLIDKRRHFEKLSVKKKNSGKKDIKKDYVLVGVLFLVHVL